MNLDEATAIVDEMDDHEKALTFHFLLGSLGYLNSYIVDALKDHQRYSRRKKCHPKNEPSETSGQT